MSNYKHVCKQCNSTEVGVQRWVNPNDDSIDDADCGSLEWCFGECQDETTILIVVEEYPDHVPVAYFAKDGSVRCEECIESYKLEPNTLWDGVTPTKIYPENLRPYSQTCHVCSKTVFKGAAPNILFENKNEPIPDPARTFESPLDCTNCGHTVSAHSHDLDEDAWCTEQGCECKEYEVPDRDDIAWVKAVPDPSFIERTDEVLTELDPELYEPVTKWDDVYGERVICDDGTYKGMFDFVPDFYARRYTDAVKAYKSPNGTNVYFIPILPSDREKFQESSRISDKECTHRYVRVADGYPRETTAITNLAVEYTTSLFGNESEPRFDPYDCEVCEALMKAGYEMDFIRAYHNEEPDAVRIAGAHLGLIQLLHDLDKDDDENT